MNDSVDVASSRMCDVYFNQELDLIKNFNYELLLYSTNFLVKLEKQTNMFQYIAEFVAFYTVFRKKHPLTFSSISI